MSAPVPSPSLSTPSLGLRACGCLDCLGVVGLFGCYLLGLWVVCVNDLCLPAGEKHVGRHCLRRADCRGVIALVVMRERGTGRTRICVSWTGRGVSVLLFFLRWGAGIISLNCVMLLNVLVIVLWYPVKEILPRVCGINVTLIVPLTLPWN